MVAQPSRHTPGTGWFGFARTDQDGLAVFKRRAPGAYELAVYDGYEKVVSMAVELRPGVNPEVVLRLPK